MINNRLLLNVYESQKSRSKISTQLLYGEKFKILSKNNKWVKIKTSFDNYTGYIKYNNFIKKFQPTHKIFKLKTKIFKKPFNKKNYQTKKFLSFASKISIIQKYNQFVEFEKNKWVKEKDLKNVKTIENNFIKIIKLFLGIRYVWGGKSYNGIDCSALLQLIFFYNDKFYPRDTKDQIKYFKKKKELNFFKKGDIIFWKGHVAICLNKKFLIHAYGPKKKVIIMNIKNTILEIKEKSKLEVIGVKSINDI
tara:strand:+ start:115 stop:864 length:750 start_codon:yes stop_codon:yes gene_type:complete